MVALTLRPRERRGAVLGGLRARPLRLSKTPASGLKGGVGNLTLPTLRPCGARRIPTSCPRAGAADPESETKSISAAAADFRDLLWTDMTPGLLR